MLYKKAILKIEQILQESTCVGIFLWSLWAATLLKKRVLFCFSGKFCEIFQNNIFAEHQTNWPRKSSLNELKIALMSFK